MTPWERLSERVRTGGVEPPQHEATGLQPAELAVARRPHGVRGGWPESNLRSPAPEAGGVAMLPHSQRTFVRVPPAGFEPAASGLRARRHRHFDHGGEQAPAAGLEPALSRLTVARLADSTTPEQGAEAAGLEPAN